VSQCAASSVCCLLNEALYARDRDGYLRDDLDDRVRSAEGRTGSAAGHAADRRANIEGVLESVAPGNVIFRAGPGEDVGRASRGAAPMSGTLSRVRPHH
jgi:hypothetical protein